jgi:hypothetical protein
MTWAAVAVGVVGAGVNAYSANKASKANSASLDSENKRIKGLLKEIDRGRENADQLREDRDIPSDLFARLFRQFPGLVSSVAPQLTDAANTFGQGNADQFLSLREKIAPGSSGLDADRLKQIQSLDPANLGQDEISALTRAMSPLLPSGTLDPTTGAVKGATTSPVSLYRNLISAKYNERRTQFLNASGSFIEGQNNAASRQQVSAADFLQLGLSTSAGLTGANIEQQQGDINAQEEWIKLAAGGLQSSYDPSANNALIASGTKGATDSLASAAAALASRK